MHESININRINHFLQETNTVVIIPIILPQLGSALAMMNWIRCGQTVHFIYLSRSGHQLFS